MERIEEGQTLEDALVIAGMLADAGVDVLDVSVIAQGGWKMADDRKVLAGSSVLPKNDPSGANIELTAAFKEKTGLPVIAVGKFGIGQAAVQAVEHKQIDMVAIGRQMICDPDTARKMLEGKDNEIIACDECLYCFATIGKAAPMGCKVNKNLPF